jgi:hypothetical protein
MVPHPGQSCWYSYLRKVCNLGFQLLVLSRVQGMTQADFDITLLAWRLGGPALLLPLQKRLGFAGLRTIKGLDKVQFIVSSRGWDGKDATANATAMLVGGCRPRVAMLDEIAVVPAPRYAAKDNFLVGLCWQHARLQNLTILDGARLEELQQLVKGGYRGVHQRHACI